MKRYLLKLLITIWLSQTATSQEYHYTFTHPRDHSSGTLTDGNLDFFNAPVFEQSLINIDLPNKDWALRLERNNQQFALTTNLNQSTAFDGSYRVEAFFTSDELSNSSNGTYDSRQGIISLYSSGLTFSLATYRESGTAEPKLVLLYQKESSEISTKNGITKLNLDQWYHVEAIVNDQGDDSVTNDEIIIYLNGYEEIRVQNVALSFLNKIDKIQIGQGSNTLRTFQGTIDEVLISSNLNEPSLLTTLPNATPITTRIPKAEINASSSNIVIQYTAPVGGKHDLFYKNNLLDPDWIYEGEIVADDLNWYGERLIPSTNNNRFHLIESTRVTRPPEPTVADIIETGSHYFDPWNTTRWADWYDDNGRLTKSFELNIDIEFSGSAQYWNPDISLLPPRTSILTLTGDEQVSIEGNGLIIDIRSPELTSKSIADLYDDLTDYSSADMQIPHTIGGITFDKQQSETPTTSSISGITFRGFQHAIASTHFNQMDGVITNCVFEFNDWALFARGTSKFLIKNNIICRNILGGVHGEYDSASWTLQDNTFYDNNPSGIKSYGDVVLDACRYYHLENNLFLGTTEPSRVKDYFTGISLYRNRGESDNIKEDASSLHLIENNLFDGGYHIAIDVAERTGYVNPNDKSLETRTYVYDNTFAGNIFSNCVIGFHILGNRNTLISNAYINVERDVTLHSVFYKSEGTLFNGEGNTDVWLWGNASDYSAFAAYLPYQLNGAGGRHISQSDRLFFASSINGTPTFHDTNDGKVFIHEQSLLNGNSMQSVFNTGGTIRDIAIADFDKKSLGLEIAVIWDQQVSRISTATSTYEDYYSIIIYDQTGKEIDRCGRSLLQWDAITAGNFIEGHGWIHIDEEAEVAAVHSVSENGSYPIYIFRRGYAEAATTNQSNASTAVADLAAERTPGTEYLSLAVARGTTVNLVTPSTGTESLFCTLSSTPQSIQLGEFDENHADGNELATLDGTMISLYQPQTSSPFRTGATGSWSSFTTGEFDGDISNGDELAIASTTAENGHYPIKYYNNQLTDSFKTQSHSILLEQTRAMAAGIFRHDLSPDGYFRRGDGRASFHYEFQPRFEKKNTGFSSAAHWIPSAQTVSFHASPFDFDGDNSVEDEQAIQLSHANNEYLELDDSTDFSTPSGSYTVEAFFNASSLPTEQMPNYNARRGIFYWYNMTDIGSLYLVREADGQLYIGGFIRKTSGFTPLLSTTPIQAGQWYHAMLRVSDNGNNGESTDKVELYLNGELTDSATNLNLMFFSSGNLMRVGHSQQSTGPRSFDGLLDGIRIIEGIDTTCLIDEIPNAREVLGLPLVAPKADEHILVLPQRNDTSPLYWMHTDGISQEIRTVPILR